MCWLTVASTLFRERATTLFPWFPWLMIGFTVVVLATWVRRAAQRFERCFFAIWIVISIFAIPAFSAHAQTFARHAITLLYLIETLVALRITVDIGRPFYQDAKKQRITRERGHTKGME